MITKKINIFIHDSNLTKIKKISVGFELNETQDQQNYCLHLCLYEQGYTQYYYLFCATYKFQLFNYNFEFFNTLLLFDELLEESKINIKETLPQKLYIPVTSIILNLSNNYDPKIDFFIYIAIAVIAKHYKRLTNFYDLLNYFERLHLDYIEVPRNYSEIIIFYDNLMKKTMMNLFFRTIHSLVCSAIMECFQQISKVVNTKIYKKPKQKCYLQYGNEFPTLDHRSMLEKIICGEINTK
ncbi:hypothetical protein COBT_002367 [Conglomerata obtusa]